MAGPEDEKLQGEAAENAGAETGSESVRAAKERLVTDNRDRERTVLKGAASEGAEKASLKERALRALSEAKKDFTTPERLGPILGISREEAIKLFDQLEKEGIVGQRQGAIRRIKKEALEKALEALTPASSKSSEGAAIQKLVAELVKDDQFKEVTRLLEQVFRSDTTETIKKETFGTADDKEIREAIEEGDPDLWAFISALSIGHNRENNIQKFAETLITTFRDPETIGDAITHMLEALRKIKEKVAAKQAASQPATSKKETEAATKSHLEAAYEKVKEDSEFKEVVMMIGLLANPHSSSVEMEAVFGTSNREDIQKMISRAEPLKKLMDLLTNRSGDAKAILATLLDATQNNEEKAIKILKSLLAALKKLAAAIKKVKAPVPQPPSTRPTPPPPPSAPSATQPAPASPSQVTTTRQSTPPSEPPTTPAPSPAGSVAPSSGKKVEPVKDRINEKLKELHNTIKENRAFLTMTRFVRLIATTRATSGKKRLRTLHQILGTDDIVTLREQVARDLPELMNLMRKKDFLTNNGDNIDEIKIVEHLMTEMAGKTTPEAALAICRRMNDHFIRIRDENVALTENQKEEKEPETLRSERTITATPSKKTPEKEKEPDTVPVPSPATVISPRPAAETPVPASEPKPAEEKDKNKKENREKWNTKANAKETHKLLGKMEPFESVSAKLLLIVTADLEIGREARFKKIELEFGTRDVALIKRKLKEKYSTLADKLNSKEMVTDGEINGEKLTEYLTSMTPGAKTPSNVLDTCIELEDELNKLKWEIRDEVTKTKNDTSPAAPAPARGSAPAGVPATASAATGTPSTPAPAPDAAEAVKPREFTLGLSPVPAMLSEIFAEVATDDATRDKLLDLQEVHAGRARLAGVSVDVSGMLEQVLALGQKKGDTPTNRKLIAGQLKRLLSAVGGANVVKLSEEEVKERDSARNLRDFLGTLTEDPEFGALNDLFEDLFEILDIDPTHYGRAKDRLEGMQLDVRTLLLEEIPGKITTLQGPHTTMAELLEALKKLGGRKQTAAMRMLLTMTQDADLAKMIADFKRLTGRSDPDGPSGRSTPPPPPPGAGSRGRGGSATGTPVAGAAGSSPDTPATDDDELWMAGIEPNDGAAATTVSTAADTSEKPADVIVTASEVLTEGEKARAINTFMNKMKANDTDNPATRALRSFLMGKIQTEQDIVKLEAFLKSAAFADEIEEKYGSVSLAELQKNLRERTAILDTLNDQILGIKTAYPRATTPESRTQLGAELADLNTKKSELVSEIGDLNKGISRKGSKKEKETRHYRSPEQLLGMVNFYFAKLTTGEDTPDYAIVLADTQVQIARARDAMTKKLSKLEWVERMTIGWLKPGLVSTLQAMVKGDPLLKKISAEQVAVLAKSYDDEGGVTNWIRGLEGSEKEKMEAIVPALIGHLAVATSRGWTGVRLRTMSLNRGQELLKNLRQAVHKYSVSQAETAQGSSIDRITAYFGHFNQINKKAGEVAQDTVVKHMQKTMGRNLFIAGGMTTGGVALASLSGLGLITAGAGSTAALAGYMGIRAESPMAKKIFRGQALAAATMAGLSGLALAAGPLAAAGLLGGGVAAPIVWKNREKILAGAKTAAPKVARAGGKVIGLGTRLAVGAVGAVGLIGTFGLAGLLPGYKKIFGLHSRPYFSPA